MNLAKLSIRTQSKPTEEDDSSGFISDSDLEIFFQSSPSTDGGCSGLDHDWPNHELHSLVGHP